MNAAIGVCSAYLFCVAMLCFCDPETIVVMHEWIVARCIGVRVKSWEIRDKVCHIDGEVVQRWYGAIIIPSWGATVALVAWLRGL